ncbi:MAG: PAS/PAC sensor signal transduction histidine kinase [Candidatus Saganbacteria bacterium]|uniref:PAS/PAC sensor signal transduction histidine kinase n=1 Tax=Candidatus Saganbacteria bacterium TaxID=2575572 RepID=A0A833NRW7_UNCSA|nr:MAG: PAS/PAC sensor signal transduction histidine kinase [Candidatus Saganbacteria bacterium]
MILFPYFELAASLFTLLFAFIIFSRHYENRTARFFARFALLAFFASIIEYSARIAFTLELAGAINRVSASLWAFVFPAFAHFCLIFAKKNSFLKSKIALFVLYLPASVLSFLFLFTDLMYKRHDIYHFGIANQPAPFYWLFAINTFVYVLWGILVLLKKSKTSPQATVRSQALFIAVGSFFPAVIGIITDELLPLALGYRPFPPTCIFGIAVMNFVIFLAMRKYALFSISPALAADIIIETMPDALLVTDLEGRIILVNDEAHKFFHVPKEEIFGRHIDKLFEKKEEYIKLYEEVVVKNIEIERFSANLVDPLGEKIPALINANKMKDSLGSTLGVVYIIRDSL